MRKFIKTISLSFAFYCIPSLSKAQTSLHDSLINVNYTRFLNKPIDSLLNHVPQSYDSLKIVPDYTMFYGANLILVYLNKNVLPPKKYIMTVWPSTRDYINRKNPQNLPWAEAWPLALLKRESIGGIEIMGPDGNILVDVDIQ